jgi:hypothetical protein
MSSPGLRRWRTVTPEAGLEGMRSLSGDHLSTVLRCHCDAHLTILIIVPEHRASRL